MNRRASIKVPATSANLGPGYDCLGIALQLYNEVTLESGAGDCAPHPMVAEAAARFFATAGIDPFPFRWTITGDVPISRGLGSSVTLRLGILNGLNALAAGPLDARGLFLLCCELEGHPDNAAPGQFGGFVVSRRSGEICRFEVRHDLQFVLLIPEFEIRTPDARKVLPASLPHEHAARNTAAAAMLTAAMASGDYELLRGNFDDYLHQPYRQPLFPGMGAIIRAGTEAGALGGFLSGSGSTLACVTLENPEAVAAAMQSAIAPRPARTLVTWADNRGTVTTADAG